MKPFIVPMIVVLMSAVAGSAIAETIKYPPFSTYSMNRDFARLPDPDGNMLTFGINGPLR
jgi:hypothetical protein